EAVNGAEVLEKLTQQDFDIILMDVQMPVMDGLEATKKIRNEFDEPKRRIPIIALTASVIRSDIDKCRAVGMDDYVPKPFSEEELFRTISKLTGKELRFTLKSDSKTGNETVRPNVDLTYLRNFCKNDHLKMKKYIDLFLNRAPKLNTALETELAENNFEEIASQAHGFKVSLMMMGMEDAKQIALKLEADCRLATKDVENIRLNTLELIRRISEAINELKQNISNFTV
ncbi:MAG: response regulator, partial [Weeksellaceae bacterium]